MPSFPPAISTPNPFLRLHAITKRYGGVTALANVDFACSLGTIHAVVGENGAGKSSLMKLIAGVTRPDEGEIYVEDKPIKFASPADAAALGIVCIFQELSLLPDLSVADNISIADPPKRFGLIDHRRQRRIAEQVLQRVGCGDIHPDERVKDLPLSRQQMVEIAKALIRSPRLIIMDEATSALTARDVEHLYRIVRGLREQGVAVLYISHRMPEISALADICSVFRNGKHIETFPMSSRTTEEIVPMMIGREVARAYPKKNERPTLARPDVASRSLNDEAKSGHADTPKRPPADTPKATSPGNKRPDLVPRPQRHLPETCPRRNRRPRRPRRPRPKRTSVGLIRRASRSDRRSLHRRPPNDHRTPAPSQVPRHRFSVDPSRSPNPRITSPDVDRRQPGAGRLPRT